MTLHTTTDPACDYYRAPSTAAEKEHYDRARGVPCLACLPDPDAHRDDVLDDDLDLDDDTRLELGDPT